MICSRKKMVQRQVLYTLLDAQKNMASTEKVDARGLVYLSRFLLRLLEKLDDELVQLVKPSCSSKKSVSNTLSQVPALSHAQGHHLFISAQSFAGYKSLFWDCRPSRTSRSVHIRQLRVVLLHQPLLQFLFYVTKEGKPQYMI